MSEFESNIEESERPTDEIDLICEKGEVIGVKINGHERKITSDESKELFLSLRDKYRSENCSFDDLFDDSRSLMSDLIERDFAPCFTIPREYLGEVLAKGALIPHETGYQKTVKLTAGTLGLVPYKVKEDRLIVLFVNKNYRDYALQPRFTLPMRGNFLFHFRV